MSPQRTKRYSSQMQYITIFSALGIAKGNAAINITTFSVRGVNSATGGEEGGGGGKSQHFTFSVLVQVEK